MRLKFKIVHREGGAGKTGFFPLVRSKNLIFWGSWKTLSGGYLCSSKIYMWDNPYHTAKAAEGAYLKYLEWSGKERHADTEDVIVDPITYIR